MTNIELNLDEIISLPNKSEHILDKIKSYDFYVFYGGGFDLEFKYNNYVSWFGKPRYIVDRAKFGGGVRGIPIVRSLADIIEDGNFCVVVSAPSYASEIIDECKKYLEEDAIIKAATEFGCTGKGYKAFLNDNKQTIYDLYDMLSDDESKRVFKTWLEGRCSIDLEKFYSICTPNNYCHAFLTPQLQEYMGYKHITPFSSSRTMPNDAYFTTGLFELGQNSVFYDLGTAYGDTIAGYFEYGVKNNGGRAIGFELDPKVCDKSNEFCRNHGYNAKVLNCGISDREAVFFDNSDNFGGMMIGDAQLSEDGNNGVRITTIDRIVNELGETPTFIKMDIEGAEFDALKGAKEIIKSTKPILGICMYHKHEDIVEIPQFIKSLRDDYKLYFRLFSILSSEMVLFAV